MGTIDFLTSSTPGERGEAAQRSPLSNDPMVNAIVRELKAMTTHEFDDPFPNLASIGITQDRYGNLTVSSKELEAALEENPKAVTEMFVGEDGIIEHWQSISDVYTGRTDPAEDDDDDDSDSGDSGYVPKDGLIDERLDNLQNNLNNSKPSLTVWKIVLKPFINAI